MLLTRAALTKFPNRTGEVLATGTGGCCVLQAGGRFLEPGIGNVACVTELDTREAACTSAGAGKDALKEPLN